MLTLLLLLLLLTTRTVACEVVWKYRHALTVIFTRIRFTSIHHSLTMLALKTIRTPTGIVVADAFQTGAVIMAGIWSANVDILFTVCTEKSVLANAFIAIHIIPANARVPTR